MNQKPLLPKSLEKVFDERFKIHVYQRYILKIKPGQKVIIPKLRTRLSDIK